MNISNVEQLVQQELHNVADKSQEFHIRHELLTELAYNSPGMLPARYVFVLTNLCNLDCSFCYQRRDLRDDRMTTEDWLKVIAQLPDYARVTLTGGEPMMFNGFQEIFSVVAAEHYCNIISNGLLLDKKKVDFLLGFQKFRVLAISVDNVGNTIRDVKERSWLRMEKMLAYFVERKRNVNPDCLLECKTVILDDNADELMDIHRYCVEILGCDHHTFQLLKGSPIQHADFMFPFDAIEKKSCAQVYKRFETIKQQLMLIQDYNERTGAKSFLHPSFADLNKLVSLECLDVLNCTDHISQNFEPCKFPWSSMHINVDGNMFPCMAVSVGNVKDQSISEMINGDKCRDFRDLLRKKGTVEGCNRCGWIRPNMSEYKSVNLQ